MIHFKKMNKQLKDNSSKRSIIIKYVQQVDIEHHDNAVEIQF